MENVCIDIRVVVAYGVWWVLWACSYIEPSAFKIFPKQYRHVMTIEGSLSNCIIQRQVVLRHRTMAMCSFNISSVTNTAFAHANLLHLALHKGQERKDSHVLERKNSSLNFEVGTWRDCLQKKTQGQKETSSNHGRIIVEPQIRGSRICGKQNRREVEQWHNRWSIIVYHRIIVNGPLLWNDHNCITHNHAHKVRSEMLQ